MRSVIEAAHIDQLSESQVRALAVRLVAEVRHKQATIDKLTHEMAVLKRLKFAARSEAFNAEQKSLLEEAIDADLEALRIEADQARAQAAPPAAAKDQPKRQPLPASLPRREIRHEPDNTTCRCGCALKRIGEDVAEKLDYAPGVFTVERHIRGKWVCAKCETLMQAPVPAHVIDKGLPTTGLLAQVLVAKYADHLPLYRQEAIFERAGVALPRSTLAQWVGACGVALQPLVEALKAALFTRAVLHADETPVAMLKPGHGKTHRASLWSYASTVFDPIKGVVFDPRLRGGRLCRQPGWAPCAGVSRHRRTRRQRRRLARHPGVRRLRRLQGAVRRADHRSRLPGACAAQVLRAVGQPPKRGG
jgi:transposase